MLQETIFVQIIIYERQVEISNRKTTTSCYLTMSVACAFVFRADLSEYPIICVRFNSALNSCFWNMLKK